MAGVQHVNLTGTDLHEPKDVGSASADELYYADGAGSGGWAATHVHEPKGAATAANNDIYVADGAGSGSWKNEAAYAELTLDLTGTLTRSFPGVTAYTDLILDYNSVYLSLFSYNDVTKELTYTGTDDIIYLWSFIAAVKRTDIGGSPEMTIALFVDTGTGFTEITSTRVARTFSGNDVGSVSGTGIRSLSNGDKLKIQVKTDAGLDILLRNLIWSIHCVKSLA